MTVSMTTKQMLAWLAEWMLLPWIELKNLGREKKIVGREKKIVGRKRF